MPIVDAMVHSSRTAPDSNKSSSCDRDSVITLHATPLPALQQELAQLEAACFDHPWGADSLGTTLAQPGSSVTVIRAAARGETAPAVGYCLTLRCEDELEILQIATHPTEQRQGLGHRLLQAVLDQAAASGCATVFLEVRRSNRAAIALYERAGFEQCGLRPGYYPCLPTPPLGEGASQSTAATEDALILRRGLPVYRPTMSDRRSP